MSCCIWRVNFVSFLNSFLSLMISLMSINANTKRRMDMRGNASMDHFILLFLHLVSIAILEGLEKRIV